VPPSVLRIAHILRDTQVAARLRTVRREVATTIEAAGAPRRELYKEQTRLDLALAAFELAKSEGLAAVRVPQIAAAVCVSPRTFNNYFAGKEQAIAWLAGRHAAGMATALRERPVDEPLRASLVEAVLGQYRPAREDGLPPHWLRDFRALVAREPALYGEYLTAVSSAERDLGDAITERVALFGPLQARVLAAMVAGAERAAVMYWMQTRAGPLTATVRVAVEQAVAGIGQTP
jgi:AcrR family transcriptional regulator